MIQPPHPTLTEEAREFASLYCLDALPAEEIRAYEAHLQLCSPCQEEVDFLRKVIAELALLPPEIQPPDRVWGEILKGIRKTPGTNGRTNHDEGLPRRRHMEQPGEPAQADEDLTRDPG